MEAKIPPLDSAIYLLPLRTGGERPVPARDLTQVRLHGVSASSILSLHVVSLIRAQCVV